MLTTLKNSISRTPMAAPFIFVKHALKGRGRSQSDEMEIIDRLASTYNVPRTFIEFGFSGWEFNCIKIAEYWEGLLIDGDSDNTSIAAHVFPKAVTAKQLWIILDSLDFVLTCSASRRIGILSINVDGNDYWFLEKLIAVSPAIIVVEFNVLLGLLPVTVPYDAAFDRTKRHESWGYYGASLAAMHDLCSRKGYSLISISKNGVNAFFVRNDLLAGDETILSLDEAFRCKRYPDGSPAAASHIWPPIAQMPYVDVTKADATNRSPGDHVVSA